LYIVLPLSLRRAAVTGPWRRAAQLSVVAAAACVTLVGFAPPAGAGTGPAGDPFGFTVNPPAGIAAPGNLAAQSPTASGPGGNSRQQLYVPDLIAAVPSGITSSQLAAISKLSGVQAVLPVDGGKVKVNGQSANVLGVSPQAFRSWTSLSTAGSAAIWSNLGQGQLVSTGAAARRLHLAAGQSYPVSAAVLTRLPFGGTTALSVTGADAMVNLTRSAQLGLARNFAVLISAPPTTEDARKTRPFARNRDRRDPQSIDRVLRRKSRRGSGPSRQQSHPQDDWPYPPAAFPRSPVRPSRPKPKAQLASRLSRSTRATFPMLQGRPMRPAGAE